MLQHLLPALIPSWRFFDRIGPAPHLEFALTTSTSDVQAEWREVRPRAARVPIHVMAGRLFWNARGNETLFLMSCAERLLDRPTAEVADDLWTRVADIVEADVATLAPSARFLRIRIVEVRREGTELVRHIPWVSQARPWNRAARSVTA